MTRPTRCPRCGRASQELERYLVESGQEWLCPGCVADVRLEGHRVVWLPRRRWAS